MTDAPNPKPEGAPAGARQQNLFDLFDDHAKRTIHVARDEVARTKQAAIGAEHLLGGLLRQEPCEAHEILTAAGLDAADLADALAAMQTPGDVEETPTQLPFTPDGQQTLQIVVQAAGQLAHRTIGTAHLLLGLLQDPNGPLAKLLAEKKVTREALGQPLMQHMQSLPVDEQMRAQALAAAQAQAQSQAQSQAAAQPAGNRNYTPSAQRVMADAERSARELRHGQVGTVHLALALLQDQDRLLSNLLVASGVRPEEVRSELLRQLRAETAEPAAAPAEA